MDNTPNWYVNDDDCCSPETCGTCHSCQKPSTSCNGCCKQEQSKPKEVPMTYATLYKECEALQEKLYFLFEKEAKSDISLEVFSVVECVVSDNYKNCFSNEVKQLAKVVDWMTQAMMGLDALACLERKEAEVANKVK